MRLTFPSYGECWKDYFRIDLLRRLLLLAFLNSAQLLLVIISSGKIPAPLIIILLQMTVPFTTILNKASQVISPQSTPRLAGLNTLTRDSLQLPTRCAEWFASMLILVAVAIAIVPVVTKDKAILGEFEEASFCVSVLNSICDSLSRRKVFVLRRKRGLRDKHSDVWTRSAAGVVVYSA